MAADAMNRHVDTLTRQPGQTQEASNALCEFVRSFGIVTVGIVGSDGEQILYSSADALEEAVLPHRVTQVNFDSATAIQQHNVTPNNWLSVRLDFTEPPSSNVHNPWDQPTPNNSRIEVVGTDQTWVTGVFESTTSFFQRRQRRRSWLHSAITFSLVQYFVAFPAALWVVYRADSVFFQQTRVHTAIRGVIYIYAFLMALLVLRIIVGALRWLFPMIELEGTRSRAARGVLGTVIGSLLMSLITTS